MWLSVLVLAEYNETLRRGNNSILFCIFIRVIYLVHHADENQNLAYINNA